LIFLSAKLVNCDFRLHISGNFYINEISIVKAVPLFSLLSHYQKSDKIFFFGLKKNIYF